MSSVWGGVANKSYRREITALTNVAKPGLIEQPVGFIWPEKILRFAIRQLVNGQVVASIKPEQFKVYENTVDYYVDRVSGSDVNNGLDWGNAFASIWVALQKTNARNIYISSGIYGENPAANTSSFAGMDIKSSCNIIAVGGPVISTTAYQGLVWTLSSGSTYSAPNALSVGSVFDSAKVVVDENGDYLQYTEQTTEALVDANPGSWWLSGTTLYVRTTDSRVPDADIHGFASRVNGELNDDLNVYLENIHFFGGSNGGFVTDFSGLGVAPVNANLVFNKCKFAYSEGGNGGLRILDANTVYSFDCEAFRNARDGFSYHVFTWVIPTQAVEIDCIGRHNGLTVAATGINNGTTLHDGARAVRVNGIYAHNEGPNMADVNAGTQSWNIGCICHDSDRVTPGNTKSNVVATSGTEVWFENSYSHSSENDFYSQDAGTYIRYKNSFNEGLHVENIGGLIESY